MGRDRFSVRREGGIEVIEGSFGPNGAGAIAQTGVKGHGFSVLRTNVGEFTVTLLDDYLSMVDGEVSLQMATPGAVRVLLGAVVMAASSCSVKILVTAMDGTTLSDAITSDANSRIHFCFALKQTSAI